VLIIGSSVDRYALNRNYPGQTYVFRTEKYQHSVVEDKAGRHLGLAVLQHPGVGLNGDLDVPFWNPGEAHAAHAAAQAKYNQTRPAGTNPESPLEAIWQFFPTVAVINHAPKFSQLAFGTASPDLVVVETSLWDLAGWWQHTGHRATPERIQQWCDKDMPYLLKTVSAYFPQSRIVFRTAPKVAPWSTERWTQQNFEAMHDCVLQKSAARVEAFEHVGVIDYYDVMEKLIASTGRDQLDSLWKSDGYHPSEMPGRLYLNEIFKLLGVKPMEAPETSRHMLREDEAFVEDEDDF